MKWECLTYFSYKQVKTLKTKNHKKGIIFQKLNLGNPNIFNLLRKFTKNYFLIFPT